MLILERLKLLAQEEGIEISEDSLRAIVSVAEGSMRDAQSALDQIIAFGGKKIPDEAVRVLLWVVDERAILSLVDAVLERDAKILVEQVQELVNSGVDPRNFCRKLIHPREEFDGLSSDRMGRASFESGRHGKARDSQAV